MVYRRKQLGNKKKNTARKEQRHQHNISKLVGHSESNANKMFTSVSAHINNRETM